MQNLSEEYGLIHSTGFTDAAALALDGWSSVRENLGAGPKMLSRYDGERNDKTFELPENTETVVVDFLFYEIGSWDGEAFVIHVNGQDIDLGLFSSELAEPGSTVVIGDGITLEKSPQGGRSGERIHEVKLTIENPGATLDLGFSSTLDEALTGKHWQFESELWGVDNLNISAKVGDAPSGEAIQPFSLYDDGASPVESASYDPATGDLTVTFSWDKLLQADGQWGNARHIDYVRFEGEMYGVNIHSEDAPQNPDGSYIYDQSTMENTFTFNIGAGHNPEDGALAFELHDYADGSVKLYDFNLSNGAGIDQTGLVAAVNAGGGDFTTIEGMTYAADTTGGSTYSEGHGIEGTTADGLYQTEKGQWNGFVYETAVENGVYDVELKLAEIWSGAQEAGARTFSLKVEDQFVFQDLDITAEHGFATAVDYVGSVEVTDGSLTIEGINGSNNAKIAGFSIWESDETATTDFAVGEIKEYRASQTTSEGPNTISPLPGGDFTDGDAGEPGGNQPGGETPTEGKVPDQPVEDGEVSFIDQTAPEKPAEEPVDNEVAFIDDKTTPTEPTSPPSPFFPPETDNGDGSAEEPTDISPLPGGDFADGDPGEPGDNEPTGGTSTEGKVPDQPIEDSDVAFIDQPFSLYDDGASPVESASYDPATGDLTITFAWDKLLQADGQWGNARHVDYVRFDGEMYGVNIHSEDAPKNPDGSYIYDQSTMENAFTINIGAGRDPADGVMAFELHDYEDGSVKLYDFNLSNGAGIDQTGLVAAVNAGGGDFTTIEGLTYAADTTGGSTYSEGHAIADTTADAIYQTEKGQWNGFVYETAVENGIYDVELKLAEIWSGAQQAGARDFSLKVEDQFVFEGLDLTAEHGFATAVDYIGSVEVTDGSLTIEGINGSNNAKIAGFSIWESDAAATTDFAVGEISEYREPVDEFFFG